tara:strand:- start:93 stop:1154 length:1062 start_codon:yes stop_codon:yes gene_type:complete
LLNIKVSRILKKKYTVFTSNCSTAIYLLLKSLKFKNKKIIIPSNICYEVFLSIIYSHNQPLVIDANKNLGISIYDLKNELKKHKNIGGIIFPYLYGNSDNFKDVLKIIKKKKLLLIEDIAGAFGGKIGKNKFGSFSDYCVGSFGQGKIIDMGYGGFLSTNNIEVYKKFLVLNKNLETRSSKSISLRKKLNKLIDLILNKKINNKILKIGNLKKYYFGIVNKRNLSTNFYKKLSYNINEIEKINNLRKKKAKEFDKLIKFKNFSSITHNPGSVYWRKNFLVKQNSFDLINYLNKNNIYARKYYPPLNYIFPSINKKLKNSEKNYKRIINFWVGKETSFKDILKIKKMIESYYNV